MAASTVTGERGFTLMELMLVLLLVGLLSGLVAPVVSGGVRHAREAVLRENLYQLRKSLDEFQADHGRYPGTLDELVQQRYLRRVPVDPLTERADTWVLERDAQDGIVDVRSGAAAAPDPDLKEFHDPVRPPN